MQIAIEQSQFNKTQIKGNVVHRCERIPAHHPCLEYQRPFKPKKKKHL